MPLRKFNDTQSIIFCHTHMHIYSVASYMAIVYACSYIIGLYMIHVLLYIVAITILALAS